MGWSRAHAEVSRREQSRRSAVRQVYVDVVLECGHETNEPPLFSFSDGRERFGCRECGGAIRREKGRR